MILKCLYLITVLPCNLSRLISALNFAYGSANQTRDPKLVESISQSVYSDYESVYEQTFWKAHLQPRLSWHSSPPLVLILIAFSWVYTIISFLDGVREISNGSDDCWRICDLRVRNHGLKCLPHPLTGPLSDLARRQTQTRAGNCSQSAMSKKSLHFCTTYHAISKITWLENFWLR